MPAFIASNTQSVGAAFRYVKYLDAVNSIRFSYATTQSAHSRAAAGAASGMQR
jgi:hypothetical protein